MLGNFYRWSTDEKQRVNKKQNVEIDILTQMEAKGSTLNKFKVSWFPVEAALSIFNIRRLLKTFFEKNLIKTKQTVIHAES